jgi:hypothetical protein
MTDHQQSHSTSQHKDGYEQKPSPLELHYLTAAYNRGEITFAQWRKRAVAWAKGILSEQTEPSQENTPKE